MPRLLRKYRPTEALSEKDEKVDIGEFPRNEWNTGQTLSLRLGACLDALATQLHVNGGPIEGKK